MRIVIIPSACTKPLAQRRKALFEPFHALFYPRGVMVQVST